MKTTFACSRGSACALLGLSTTLCALGANRNYPDVAPPCNTTLQACIDGASSGDTIRLLTDSHIAEDVLIRKTLRLEPGQSQPSVRSVTALASTTDVNVVVNGLTSRGGASRVRGFLQAGGASLHLTVSNSTLVGVDFNPALEITSSNAAGAYGAAQATFEHNTVAQSARGNNCAPAIRVTAFQPGMSAAVRHNEVTATQLGQCSAVQLYGDGPVAAGAWTLDAQMDHNRVRGTGQTGTGIEVRTAGRPGSAVRAAVVGNLVTGGGFEEGVLVMADGRGGVVEAQVLGNTVTESTEGMRVSARTDLGSSVSGLIANNLLAHHPQRALSVQDGLAMPNHHNLVFASPPPANGYQAYGPSTRQGNPSFVNRGGGDYRLRSDSDAVDHGDDALVEGANSLDLDGQPRRVRAVDLGTYEFQGAAQPREPDIHGVPALGHWMLISLAAGLGAFGVGARARHRRRAPESDAGTQS